MLAWRLKLCLLLGTLLASLLAALLAWDRLARLFLARETQSIHDELLGWHAILALVSLTVFRDITCLFLDAQHEALHTLMLAIELQVYFLGSCL